MQVLEPTFPLSLGEEPGDGWGGSEWPGLGILSLPPLPLKAPFLPPSSVGVSPRRPTDLGSSGPTGPSDVPRHT